MSTDLDALIAEARALSPSGIGVIQRLADALEQSQAELRQERERADEANHAAGRHKSDAAYWENEYETAEDMKAELRTALSRAEETIEKVRSILYEPFPANSFYINGMPSQLDALREFYNEELPDALEKALTEYGKQKEADRG